MRRSWWLVTLAAAMLLIAAGCSNGGGSNKTPTTATGATPTRVATPPATTTAGLASPTIEGGASPTPAQTTTGLRPCGPSDVTARASAQSAEGAIGGAVTITNTSSGSCAVNPPTVTLRNSSGSELASGSGGASTLALEGGRSASITFIWTNWCADAPSGPLSVAVTAGGDPIVTSIAGTSASSVPVPRCDAQTDPSRLSVTDVRLQQAG